jgi:putative ABC transport system ATP-binding protein
MTDSKKAQVVLDNVHLTLSGGGGQVNILRGVDLSVTPQETVSVVGPSGSGKTTMLMVIAGLEKPTSGGVHVAGRDLVAMNEDELARFRRKQVGIVFQSYHLVPTMTALENVALPLEFAGASDAFSQAVEGLEAVGLGNRMKHYPSQLSGGEQQRVAIARAFAAHPAILLADEPTGNLDAETGGKVIDLLFSLQERYDTTMILITHDASMAGRCSRQVHMSDGRVFPNGRETGRP